MADENYIDDYATCERTYASLWIYCGDLDPDEVTTVLGVSPTEIQRKGDQVHPKLDRRVAISGWFLHSRSHVESRDVRRHIDWLLDQVGPHPERFEELRAKGCRMTVPCYWSSASGHGGPMLSPTQMRRLVELGLEIWFDVYFTPADPDD